MTSSPFGANSAQRRLQLFEMGQKRVTLFCLKNGFKVPTVQNRTVGGNTGMCFPEKNAMGVDVDVTALDAVNPAHMRWSWPGYKTDRTACGVVAHEMGHQVEYNLAKKKVFQYQLWKQARAGKRVSGYEPNYAESFAETMRLFILNPDLLRLAIPGRYEYITDVLGLQPSETRSWKEVIANQNYFPAAEKWIAAK